MNYFDDWVKKWDIRFETEDYRNFDIYCGDCRDCRKDSGDCGDRVDYKKNKVKDIVYVLRIQEYMRREKIDTEIFVWAYNRKEFEKYNFSRVTEQEFLFYLDGRVGINLCNVGSGLVESYTPYCSKYKYRIFSTYHNACKRFENIMELPTID